MSDRAHLQTLEKHIGKEAVAGIVAAWIEENHRPRTLLEFNPKPQKPARAPHYLAFVRTLPCCNCGADPKSTCDHIGPSGMGQKTSDYRTIPLCWPCHQMRQTGKMPLFNWREHMIQTIEMYTRWVERR